MSEAGVLSVAIFELVHGHEADALATLRTLIAGLAARGYSTDSLYRDSKSSSYILVRRWTSEDTRQAALEDPELLRCWAKLSHEIRTSLVYETLEDVPL
jgi:hypothetical protein